MSLLTFVEAIKTDRPSIKVHEWLNEVGFKYCKVPPFPTYPQLIALQNLEQGKEYHRLDVLDHCLEALDHMSEMSKCPGDRIAAFLHDIGKPKTRILKPDGRISFPDHAKVGAELINGLFEDLAIHDQLYGTDLNGWRKVQTCTLLHMDVQMFSEDLSITNKALRRLKNKAGIYYDELFLLCKADRLAQYNQSIEPLEELKKRIEYACREHDTFKHFPNRLLSGIDICTILGIEPGPEVGRVLKALEKAQELGLIRNQDEATYFVAQQRHLDCEC